MVFLSNLCYFVVVKISVHEKRKWLLLVIAFHMSFSGWVAVAPDDDWHFYWASTTTCRNLFAVDSGKLQLLIGI